MEQDKIKQFKKVFTNILALNSWNEGDDDNLWKDTASGDELDQVMKERDQELSLKLKGRQSFYLKKIAHGLKKIEDGTFGTCEECDNDISHQRLMARPTATLCIHCKEDQEMNEKHIPYQKRSHTLGKDITNNAQNVIQVQFGEDGNNGKQMKTPLPQ